MGWLVTMSSPGHRVWLDRDYTETEIMEDAKVFPLVLSAKLEAAKRTRRYDNPGVLWEIQNERTGEFLPATLSPKSKVKL